MESNQMTDSTHWFLKELSKFSLGIDLFQFSGYVRSYLPYRFDPADYFEGFLNYVAELEKENLILVINRLIYISEKGLKCIKEHQEKSILNLIEFYRQCLRERPPIAPINLIYDSQVTKIIDEIFSRYKEPVIVDYGCGTMRLLNALLSSHKDKRWAYYGADIDNPRTLHSGEYAFLKTRGDENRWQVGTLEDLRLSSKQYDVFIFMNVLHEAPIIGIANAMEDARQYLSDTGVLFVIDTVFIPEGEPRFVPFYPWEIKSIFPESEDLSYRTRSDIPILFFAIAKKDIPCYHSFPDILKQLIVDKREKWSQLSVHLQKEENIELREELGLGKDHIFDYGYLNALVANANFRVIEYDSMITEATGDIDSCAIKFFDLVKLYIESGKEPTSNQIYETLGKEYEYIKIKIILDTLSRFGWIIKIENSWEPIRTTIGVSWDFLLQEMTNEIIKEEGFEGALRILEFWLHVR